VFVVCLLKERRREEASRKGEGVRSNSVVKVFGSLRRGRKSRHHSIFFPRFTPSYKNLKNTKKKLKTYKILKKNISFFFSSSSPSRVWRVLSDSLKNI